MTAGARPAGITVLYIHPVGAFGGAGRSLFELLRGFPAGSVRPRLLIPRGRAAEIFEREGHAVLSVAGIAQFDATRFGHYRGLRWLILLREFWFLPSTVWGIIRARLAWPDIGLIHVNELTAIPAAVLAKRIFGVPVVMHVRSVQHPMERGLRGRLLKHLVCRHVDQLVAIDNTVRESLPADLSVHIVRNGFPAHARAGNAALGPPQTARGSRRLRVGFVGVLLKLKGVYEFVEAARICAERGLDVEFVIVGENARALRGVKGYVLKRFGFAADVHGDLERYVAAHGLQERVKLLGFTPDVKAVYDSLDVLCFPSHLDACGRPVFEAAFSGVPSIVAVSDPREDTFIEGETGIRIPARDPVALADAIEHFCVHPGEVERMGAAARRLALRNFDIAANAARMLDIYRCLAQAPGAAAPAGAAVKDMADR